MTPRFPTISMIRNNLSTTHPDNAYPAMTGALTGYYKIAVDEFEHLRALASASASGSPEDRAALEQYLVTTESIAEMYSEDVRFAPAD